MADQGNVFAARMEAAFRAAEAATGAKRVVTDTDRDPIRQAQYYSNFSGRTFTYQGQKFSPQKKGGLAAAPPGLVTAKYPKGAPGSRHQIKEANDLGPGPVLDWIRAHAREFGLETIRNDTPHIQLARGIPKTRYDSTPVAAAYAGDQPLTPAQQAAARLAAGRPQTLRKGATDATTGGAVTRLQQQLAASGFDVGAVDGRFGRRTEAAVRAAEKQYGLNVERPGKGAAGPQVQAALEANAPRDVALPRQRPDPSGPGAGLSAGVVPTGGPLSGMVGSPPPIGIGRSDRAGGGVPLVAGRPDVPVGRFPAAGAVPPPRADLLTRQDINRFDTEAMAPSVAPSGPTAVTTSSIGPDPIYGDDVVLAATRGGVPAAQQWSSLQKSDPTGGQVDANFSAPYSPPAVSPQAGSAPWDNAKLTPDTYAPGGPVAGMPRFSEGGWTPVVGEEIPMPSPPPATSRYESELKSLREQYGLRPGEAGPGEQPAASPSAQEAAAIDSFKRSMVTGRWGNGEPPVGAPYVPPAAMPAAPPVASAPDGGSSIGSLPGDVARGWGVIGRGIGDWFSGTEPAAAKSSLPSPAVPTPPMQGSPGALYGGFKYTPPQQQQGSLGYPQYAGPPPGPIPSGWAWNGDRGGVQRLDRSVIENEPSSYGSAGFGLDNPLPRDEPRFAPMYEGPASSPSGYGGIGGEYPAPQPANMLQQLPSPFYAPGNVPFPSGGKPSQYASLSGGVPVASANPQPAPAYAPPRQGGLSVDVTRADGPFGGATAGGRLGPAVASAGSPPIDSARYALSNGYDFSAAAPWTSPSAAPGGVPFTPGGVGSLMNSITTGAPGRTGEDAYSRSNPRASLDYAPVVAAAQEAQARQALQSAVKQIAPGTFGGDPRTGIPTLPWSSISGGPPTGGSYARNAYTGPQSAAWNIYTAPGSSVIGGSSNGVSWAPSGYTPESGTPYNKNIGQSVDQYGNRVTVGSYVDSKGRTQTYSY